MEDKSRSSINLSLLKTNHEELLFIIIISLCTFFAGYLYKSTDLLFYFSYTFNMSPYSPENEWLDRASNFAAICGSLFSIFLLRKAKPKITFQIVLSITFVVYLLLPFSSNYSFFSFYIIILDFITSILYITAIVIVIQHIRYRTERMHFRLIVALLASVTFYFLGSTFTDIIRVTFETVTPNSYMVNYGWKIIISLPAILAFVILVIISFMKWKSDALLTRIYGSNRGFVGITKTRRTVIGCYLLICFTYFNGADTIENIIPTMISNSDWNKLSMDVTDITTDIIALLSIIVAYFILQKLKLRKAIIISSIAVAFCMISGVIFTYVFDGLDNHIALMILGTIFIIIVLLGTYLSTFTLPLIMIIKNTKTERLFIVIPLADIFDRISLEFAYITNFDLNLISSTICSVAVVLIAFFVIPNEKSLIKLGSTEIENTEGGDKNEK